MKSEKRILSGEKVLRITIFIVVGLVVLFLIGIPHFKSSGYVYFLNKNIEKSLAKKLFSHSIDSSLLEALF